MYKTIKYFAFGVSLMMFYSFSDNVKLDEKIIKILNCQNTEASADIELSVENNKEYLSQNHIQIEILKSKHCGYIFIYGKKKIKGVLTDIELNNEIKKIYGLE